MTSLSLAFGLEFAQLYARENLLTLDTRFIAALRDADAALAAQLEAARVDPASLAAKAESELLLALAPHLEDFIGQLFGVRTELRALAERHHALTPIYECRRRFVQRKALRQVKAAEAASLDGAALEAELAAKFGEVVTELAFARHVNRWSDDEAANADDLTLAGRYAAW